MSHNLESLRAAVAAAIAGAHEGRGELSTVEQPVEAFAKARRLAGTPVTDVVVEVKALLREHAGQHAWPFSPSVVAWTLAGYYS